MGAMSRTIEKIRIKKHIQPIQLYLSLYLEQFRMTMRDSSCVNDVNSFLCISKVAAVRFCRLLNAHKNIKTDHHTTPSHRHDRCLLWMGIAMAVQRAICTEHGRQFIGYGFRISSRHRCYKKDDHGS